MLNIQGGISFLESASTLLPPTVREKGESRSEATSLYCIKLLTYASCTTIVLAPLGFINHTVMVISILYLDETLQ